YRTDPIGFHPALIDLCDSAVQDIAGTSHRMHSGPLHDAAEMVRAGVPTAMMFVQSLRGISHNKIEDTKEEHLVLAVEALDRLATKTIAWILLESMAILIRTRFGLARGDKNPLDATSSGGLRCSNAFDRSSIDFAATQETRSSRVPCRLSFGTAP
ncbi:MAG: M20/M25/M40 family metallo-hydrolase, partial [Armatimonadetes bacterium]|nr:M20/M25/M40 family metallo-hydrolase [Armatimonadota bacterium]